MYQQRPQPGETEDDLLRLQEEFLQKKAENKGQIGCVVNSDNQKKSAEIKQENATTNVEEQLANTFEDVPRGMNIGKIIEKQGVQKNVSAFKFNPTRGFPQAKRRDCSAAPTKGSIFSQQIKRMKPSETPMEVDAKPETSTKIKFDLPLTGTILTGPDRTQIHEQNLNLMKTMSEQEILEEREKLLTTMDPAIVAFLKSRRKEEVLENRNPTIEEQNQAADSINFEDIETTCEVLAQPKADKWLHFDIVESNKLAWMKNIDVPKIDKNASFEARFDFEGWLLPFSQTEINETNRTLYHHGDEPGRPGYTLQELFQLSRSSVMQQKIIALNSIANILALNATGVYDNVIDIPIEQLFFVLRVCLDDNTPAILNASIKAMRNLISSQIDETLLDSLLGFGLGEVLPTLAIDENDDDNTVNDQQLAETNLIKCLARTEILTRIRYIINTVRPSMETVIYCLDILIRLCKDSRYILTRVFNCEGLIKSIINNFAPTFYNSASTYKNPFLPSIKFLRVLSSRSAHIANQLVNKYQILDSLTFYLSDDRFSLNVEGLKLQIESLHLWSILLKRDLQVEYVHRIEPSLLRMLHYHYKNTNFNMQTKFVRQAHVAALLIFLAHLAEKNYLLIEPFLGVIEQCAVKWISQFASIDQFLCGKLQIIAALLNCASNIRRYNLNYSGKLDELVFGLVRSQGINIVTGNIKSGSMLLNNYEAHKSSDNLKSLEGSAWNAMDHVIPAMQTTSCLPFLCNLTKYLIASNNIDLQLAFLQHQNVQLYLTELQKCDKYSLTTNWFTRIETFFIMDILKLSFNVRSKLFDTTIYFEITAKCVSVFASEQNKDTQFILENIIFSPDFYPSHVFIQKLHIAEDVLDTSLENLSQTAEVYIQMLGLKSSTGRIAKGTIPIDWMYIPIIVFYSNQQQNKPNGSEDQQTYIMTKCLNFILMYEQFFPSIASLMDPTDRFCRLACVFLGNDNLFLSEKIHLLLEKCVKYVVKFDLDFNKEIEGLNSFQDFYTQLLEQYQGVSYGDVLFGNVILVPLAQKHKKQYRKTLWSEYMGVAQVLNLTEEQCFLPIDVFLDPPEDDVSLINSYRRALLSKTLKPNTILYKIAKHHVGAFMLQSNK